VLAKRRLQSGRIDALNDQPQPGVGRRIAKPQAERFVQPLQVNTNEIMHLPVGVGPGDHAENGIQQHRGQIEPLAFVATMSGMVRKISSSDAGMGQPPIRVVAYRFRHFRSRESQIEPHRSEN